MRLQRLSTGLRINRGSDDPAGLIISERIRSDIRGVEQGIKNSERASSVIATTEGSLNEVNDLLNSIRALIVEAANTGAFSPEEIEANQQQIDSAIDSITRISNTATFAGLRLLDGSLAYNLSGLLSSSISKAMVNGAAFVDGNSVEVEVEVLASAQVGALYLRGDYSGGVASGMNGLVLEDTSLRIQGSRGVAEITVVQSAQLSAIVNAINLTTAQTGVKAELVNPLTASSGIVFTSVDFGSNTFVSVERIGADPGYFETYKFIDSAEFTSGTPFDWGTLVGAGTLTIAKRDTGRDVEALINGTFATGRGINVSINTPTLALDLLLNEDFATRPSQAGLPSIVNFHIVSGGAVFQLGPVVTPNQQVNLGVQSVAASLLGGTLIDGTIQYLNTLKTGESNSLAESAKRSNFTAAQDILAEAIDEVSSLRGRLGAFERNVLQTNVRSLQSSFENLSASSSRIRDADFAVETSALTRAQILASAGTTVLALANQQSQAVLQLLG